MKEAGLSTSEKSQRAHYNKNIEDYEKHYTDTFSEMYRNHFFYNRLFAKYSFEGKSVLEAMCGGGYSTKHLLSHKALVTGLDISENCVARFQERWPNCNVLCSSILSSGIPDESFDVVMICGGLHHLHPSAPNAIQEAHRVLKQGGALFFIEPHTGSFADIFRKLWYRMDNLFEKNEAPIDVEELEEKFQTQFLFQKKLYGGNIAYLLVFNSMIFRIPSRLKKWYSPGLFLLESAIQRIQGKLLSCFVLCHWEKK